MAENFNLIFGSQAPTTATWSDADYQTGWSTVGSTPPTAEQFDFLQNRADLKAKELNDALTPLVQKSEADGRQAGTIYASGAYVTVDGLPNGWLLECVVPGTSGTVAITIPDPLIDGATIIDGSVTWKLRKVATNGSIGYRQPNTAYTAGQIAYHSALPTGYYLECTTEGTTSAGEITPSSTIGDTVTDGTVVWTVNSVTNKLDDNDVCLSDLDTVEKDGIYRYGVNLETSPAVPEGFLQVLFGKTYPNQFNSLTVQKTINLLGNTYTRFKRNNDTTPIWSAWRQQEAIIAKSLGENGYIKYASGLILQWGRVLNTAPPYTTITFPITFTTRYTFITTPNTSSNNVDLSIYGYTGNGIGYDSSKIGVCTIRNGADAIASTADIQWLAIGY